MQTSRTPKFAPGASQQRRVLGGRRRRRACTCNGPIIVRRRRLVVEKGLDGRPGFLVSSRRRREAFGLLALARVEEPLGVDAELPYIFDAQVTVWDADVGLHESVGRPVRHARVAPTALPWVRASGGPSPSRHLPKGSHLRTGGRGQDLGRRKCSLVWKVWTGKWSQLQRRLFARVSLPLASSAKRSLAAGQNPYKTAITQ